jgi:hypothetical protein
MRALFTFAFLVSVFSAQAQLEIRPFLGMNFSNVSDSPDGASTQAKVGGQIGASVMIGNRFHLNPGIAYFSRSTEFSSAGNVNVDQTVEGVTIPILVGYRFVDPTTEPILNLRLFAGPSVMFLTTTKYDNGEISDAVNWNSSQWGAQLGAGLDVAIFFVDVAYEFGLTNTHDGGEGVFEDFSEIKQNTFLVNAGVRLSFSR